MIDPMPVGRSAPPAPSPRYTVRRSRYGRYSSRTVGEMRKRAVFSFDRFNGKTKQKENGGET